MSQSTSSSASAADAEPVAVSASENEAGVDANVSMAASSSSETFDSWPILSTDDDDDEFEDNEGFALLVELLPPQDSEGDAMPPNLDQENQNAEADAMDLFMAQVRGHQLSPVSLLEDPDLAFNSQISEVSVDSLCASDFLSPLPKQSPDPRKQRKNPLELNFEIPENFDFNFGSSQNQSQNESQAQSENADPDSDSD